MFCRRCRPVRLVCPIRWRHPTRCPTASRQRTPTQPASSLALPEPGAGITTLQQYDPNAPAVLIQPYLSVGERFTDNVNFTHSDRIAAAETSLIPAVSISADTPRLRGVLSAQAYGNLYVPSAGLDQVVGNLFGSGTATIVPDRLFVDANSVITQGSTLPGLGFVSPSLLPRNQQTQVFATSISPYLRESFDGMVDTELRYRFGATNFGGNTAATRDTADEQPSQWDLERGFLHRRNGSKFRACAVTTDRRCVRLQLELDEPQHTVQLVRRSSISDYPGYLGAGTDRLPEPSISACPVSVIRWRDLARRRAARARPQLRLCQPSSTDGSRAFTALPDPPIIR